MQKLSGNIIDLERRRIFPGTVEWSDGIMRNIRTTPGKSYSRYIAPGFVDAHVHIESSLLPPSEFARLAVVHGTVGTVSDPHEIANVLGVAGVNYMLRDARRTPFHFAFGVPSCVPATDFETAGARLSAAAVTRLLARKEIRYLSEVMNFPGVLQRAPELMAMIRAAQARNKPVDGHAPGLRGADAVNYAEAGISTDHECFTLREARDKLTAGMKILIREGSAARNFAALAPLLRSHPDRCMFCCDDLHPDLLLRQHIDGHVRRALRLGYDRFDVLACASLHPVQHYGLDIGCLREGEPADFIVFTGWKTLRVQRTYLRGRLVARNGKSLLPRCEPRLSNAFRARKIRPDQLRIEARSRHAQVICAVDGQLVTGRARARVGTSNGWALPDPRRDLLKLAVVNRYAAHAQPAVCFVRGFGLGSGALASSVAHDSHNIIAVGADDESLAAAINLIVAHRGGLAAVGHRQEKILPLPIAGLMSDQPGLHVAREYEQLDRFAKQLGSKLGAPFMTLSFMALLVIPELKLSDRGLFSAQAWDFVSVFE